MKRKEEGRGSKRTVLKGVSMGGGGGVWGRAQVLEMFGGKRKLGERKGLHAAKKPSGYSLECGNQQRRKRKASNSRVRTWKST